ncbi:hypothetical protein ALC57_17730 [Trachymyrmex cornetzi]|uniref:RNase H type-1 domain-containing protein n=1 Tax=Trachymyrmex cornetzi TaxID=471704 RepID=A0A151ITG8_9HYME|nr:hypothetical protein ALC57_17730 [Trachymyrmex cornetzi]
MDNTAELRKEAITFYTDGSKLDERGCAGAASYSPELGVSFRYKLTPDTTVFTAEAWAIYQTLLLIQDVGYSKAIIFSDSKSVLESINSSKIINRNYVIHWIKRLLRSSSVRGIDVSPSWIPAHRGIPGNEIADRAAKEATEEGGRDNFKLPSSDLVLIADRNARERFIGYFEEASFNTGTQFARFYSEHYGKTWFYHMSLRRQEIVLINRLRANHYNLNYSLHRKNMVDSPVCPCGDPRQDVNHVIFHCPLSRGRFAPLSKFLLKSFPLHSGYFSHANQTASRIMQALTRIFQVIEFIDLRLPPPFPLASSFTSVLLLWSGVGGGVWGWDGWGGFYMVFFLL